MGITPNTEVLRRYTDLPGLFYLLSSNKITLLDPSSWDDKNDSHYLLQYKKKKELGTVLALCLTSTEETYHHWRIFSHGSSGVCISFHRDRLVSAVKNQAGTSIQDIVYRKIRIGRQQIPAPTISELPFVKRAAFDAEKEVRILYESQATNKSFLDIPIDISCVLRITLSPWIHPRLKETTMNAIKSIPGCNSIDVRRSTLIGNAEWKKLGEQAI